MTTREYIIQTADNLIREKGYNAFSFVDIANVVGIKKPSIHYHFPHKTDLGVAVIEYHHEKLQRVIEQFRPKSAIEKLDKFFSIYSEIRDQDQICLVGSLSTDFNTLEPEIKHKISTFSNMMLDWVIEFLKEGKDKGIFYFNGQPRTKAILIISNMIAIVPLSRLTKEEDFQLVIKTIKQELLHK